MIYKIYKGFDTHKDALLDRAQTMAGATFKAKKYAEQYQTSPIMVRDVFGGLRVEINSRAPEQHRVKVTP